MRYLRLGGWAAHIAGYALVGITGPEPGDAPETAVDNECPLVANTNPLSALWQHPPRGGGDKSEK